jgi:hypothetical protein
VSNWRLRNSLALALCLTAGLAGGADDEVYSIEVSALREPVDKSYRRMVSGMDLFQEMHALAPNADLRYRLLPRKRDTDMQGILLHVVADRLDIPVAVAPDLTFTLPRDSKALKQDALVRSERRANSMTWRTDVRTPGVPAGARRLGDLRLECLVGKEAGLVSEYPGLIGWIMRQQNPRSFCKDPEQRYLLFADRALFAVTLVSGSRRQVLSVNQMYAGNTPKDDMKYCDCAVLADRAYVLPLGDASWPDDTLVEFEYVDGPGPVAEAMPIGWSRQDVSAAFGDARVRRFDNGYELWIYETDVQRPRRSRNEFIVLFSPAGVVSKARLRPPPA